MPCLELCVSVTEQQRNDIVLGADPFHPARGNPPCGVGQEDDESYLAVKSAYQRHNARERGRVPCRSARSNDCGTIGIAIFNMRWDGRYPSAGDRVPPKIPPEKIPL